MPSFGDTGGGVDRCIINKARKGRHGEPRLHTQKSIFTTYQEVLEVQHRIKDLIISE